MKTLSIKQPWASLIIENIKNIENRTWKCPEKYIGQRILVHASSAKTIGLMANYLNKDQLLAFREKFGWSGLDFLEPRGAIIGSVEIVDCVINHPSVWAEKTDMHTVGWSTKPIYNWVLANPIKFSEPIPAKGKLMFWDFDL